MSSHTSSSKNLSSVQINIIRSLNNQKMDDTIRIRPTNNNNIVEFRYTDAVNNGRHELRLTADEVRLYFVSLFHILKYDTDPFVSVQVTFPAFPCILLNVKDLESESLRLRIQSMIEFTLKTSFAKMDDCDDMPPLECACGTRY